MKDVLKALTEMQMKIPVQTIILILIISFLLSMIIYFTYKFTYNGVVYNQRFNLSIVMITLITTIVMIVIGSNISVSLGMVGALSIVRFRTAVKDPRDTAFIFWGIVVGLSCGTQNYYVAIIGSMFLCILLFMFKRVMYKDNRYLLIIKGNNFSIESLDKYLSKKIKKYDCKGKYIDNNKIELIYNIVFDRKSDSNIVEELSNQKGIDIVNLVQSNTDTMG